MQRALAGELRRSSDYLLVLLAAILLFVPQAGAQDGRTSLEAIVKDLSGARIAHAAVSLLNPDNGFHAAVSADGGGRFSFPMLAPGHYTVTASAPGMADATQSGLELHVGGSMQLQFRLRPAGRAETVTVLAPPTIFDPDSGEVSQVIDERAIADLPLNGRRYTDLALLSPGVTQDPRGLTSGSNGDLSYGGTRGYQNSYLVDGADNNSFYAQARGRYRAPYQFSDEVIKEFRVSSNGYSAELGRAGGAVFNVVTNSGGNHWPGTGFFYVRDRDFDAQSAYVSSQPDEQQRQFGGTFSGPLVKNRVFLYLGYDQHQLTVPQIMQFGNGAAAVVPQPADYDRLDKAQVFAAAAQLNSLAGEYPTTMGGNAGFAKLDFMRSSKQLLFFRLSTSRYSGTNNVFFDPASPITTFTESNNGSEDVATEKRGGVMDGAPGPIAFRPICGRSSRAMCNSRLPTPTHLRSKIYGLVDGMGRSNIMPRETREHKLHIADTISYNTGRMNWKFGGDFLQAWIYNYYPAMYGGEFYFNNVKVNPWIFTPMKYGEPLTPLRAYAHDVPRYYMQDFGNAESHPNSRSYAIVGQDTIRVAHNFTVNLGLRYDLQTFEVPGLVSNPLYAPSGKIPTVTDNFSPRLGLTYSLGDHHPVVLRGGFGRFYSVIPNIYASEVETENGITSSDLFLDIMKPADAAIFPKYPNALVDCPPGTIICALPAREPKS